MATSDVSVRVAWADDAAALADVQARAFPAMYGALLPADAFDIDRAAATHAWRSVLTRPTDARQRVLIALDRDQPSGYVLTSPAADPDCDPISDGEMGDLVVSPQARGEGHGSRLLQAGVDTLRADRFTRAVTWVLAGDDDLRRFLTDAGWAADGAHRELDLDGAGTVVVKQVRLHTSLA